MNLTRKIKDKGLELGFSHIGITTADDFSEYREELLCRNNYETWTCEERSKYPGRTYLVEATSPTSYYPQGKSIICATLGYSHNVYPEELTSYVSRFYLSRAYIPQEKDLAGLRVSEFCRYLKSLSIGLYEGDSEVPQRAACARAGIITYGKNNFAYTKEDGSFNVLYTFLVDTVLDYDEPTIRCDCPESCTKCIDACPSKALEAPRSLDPLKCAMDNHQRPLGKYTEDLWDKFGVRIHGCDECQVMCPRNIAVLKRSTHKDLFLEELKERLSLEKVLFLDEEYYEETIKPIMYHYIRDLDIFRRNAAIAIGNTGDIKYIQILERALKVYSDNAELKKAINWAINRLTESEKD